MSCPDMILYNITFLYSHIYPLGIHLTCIGRGTHTNVHKSDLIVYDDNNIIIIIFSVNCTGAAQRLTVARQD